MQPQEYFKSIPWEQIQGYMGDLDSHLEELLARKKKFRQGDIENEEAERLSTTSIVQFHEKLTKFLKSSNIKISNKEEKQQLQSKLENVLNSIVSVQTQINENKNGDDIYIAIEQMITEVNDNLEGSGNPKITELANKFAALSYSITEGFKELKKMNEEFKAANAPAQLKNALGIKPKVNNIQQQEELKESEIVAAAKKFKSEQSFADLFSFYNDLDNLKRKDYQIKQNYQYIIFHPFKVYEEDISIEKMEKIEVTLEICTLLKGMPHGLAVIQCKNSQQWASFRGVGVFNQGKLDNGPFICINGTGWGNSFSKMENGRPADDSNITQFYKNGYSQHVDSLEEKTDVSEQQYYSGKVDKERRANGQGKKWDDDGSIYIGGYKKDCKTEGKQYKLQRDHTHTLFHVKFNEMGYDIERKEISKGHKIV